MSILTTLEKARSLALARAELAELKLQDAHRPSNSLWTRFSCALDVVYLCALCVTAAPDNLQDHPNGKWVMSAETELRLSHDDAVWVCAVLLNPMAVLEITEVDLARLLVLASDALVRVQLLLGKRI